MYPLMGRARFHRKRIYVNQTTEGLIYGEDGRYTSNYASHDQSGAREQAQNPSSLQNPLIFPCERPQSILLLQKPFFYRASQNLIVCNFGFSLFLSVFPVCFYSGQVPLRSFTRITRHAQVAAREDTTNASDLPGHPSGRSVELLREKSQ